MLKTKFSLSFLSPEGVEIYSALKKHCTEHGLLDIDEYELAVLAHNFDQFSVAAAWVTRNGSVHEMPTKTGTYPMVHPQFLVMEKCQNHILKHSPRFGINPADRVKLGLKEPEKKKGGFETGPMKVAK